jgi:hypothetical protein
MIILNYEEKLKLMRNLNWDYLDKVVLKPLGLLLKISFLYVH